METDILLLLLGLGAALVGMAVLLLVPQVREPTLTFFRSVDLDFERRAHQKAGKPLGALEEEAVGPADASPWSQDVETVKAWSGSGPWLTYGRVTLQRVERDGVRHVLVCFDLMSLGLTARAFVLDDEALRALARWDRRRRASCEAGGPTGGAS